MKWKSNGNGLLGQVIPYTHSLITPFSILPPQVQHAGFFHPLSLVPYPMSLIPCPLSLIPYPVSVLGFLIPYSFLRPSLSL